MRRDGLLTPETLLRILVRALVYVIAIGAGALLRTEINFMKSGRIGGTGARAGNLLLRRAQGVPMFDLSAWLCLVAAVPLWPLTLVHDGVQPTWRALSHMSLPVLLCMLWIGFVSTCTAYWLWNRLLRDYPAAQVVPFALLVPFVGSAASSIVFGERFGPLRLSGMVVVVCGIAIMLLSPRSQLPSKQILPEIG